jgi:hypothetical protein
MENSKCAIAYKIMSKFPRVSLSENFLLMGMEVNFDLEEITFYFSGKAITFLKIIIV